MIILDATTKKIEVETSAAVSVDYYSSYVDIDTAAPSMTPGASDGNVATATTTDLVTAPASGVQRQIKYCSLRNRGTSEQTVIIKLDNSGTEVHLTPETLLRAGETLIYTDTDGWQSYDSTGRIKVNSPNINPTGGFSSSFFKIGTGHEAVGRWYSHGKDLGTPGAWSPGAPGLAGRVTDGTAAADGGCVLVLNAVIGENYLTSFIGNTSVANMLFLMDILWVNTGVAVTTTTAQTINSVTFPSRDILGTTDGEGVWVGLLATAAIGGGIVTNTTMSYTNSAGTAGKTATISSWPATALIGTLVWFELAAGDSGVQSIQSITLGTTYSSGSLSLFAARIIASAPTAAAANQNAIGTYGEGIRLYDGVCLIPIVIAATVAAANSNGTITVESR